MSRYTYIDLFCGAGGFSVGFQKVGFKNVFSLDNNKDCLLTYRKNFPDHFIIEKDICELKAQEIKKIIKNIKISVIVGGPPCQGFSMAGNIGRKFIDDPRNHLFREFVRIVDIVKPSFFIMENVARLDTHNSGKTKEAIISSFNNIGYNVKSTVLNAADFSVPQIRKRIVFIGTTTKMQISFPSGNNTKHKTVKFALSDLPSLLSGEKSQKIANHLAMSHSKQMLKKMSYVKNGGNRLDIPLEIRPLTGDARKYIRYNSDKPSITITGDMRKVFHYEQNRALTVRELARLQSFDDDFIFEGKSISQQQQVGNAVPPLLAMAIAKKIKQFLDKIK